MTRRRRGLTHRLTALLLAAAMPVCCCFMNVVTGAGCCAKAVAAVVETDTTSCCAVQVCCIEGPQASTSDEVPAPDNAEETCTCCMKAPSPSFTWTLPVDSIGTPALELSLDTAELSVIATSIVDHAGHGPWSDPPPTWLRAAARRGIVILNC